MNIKTIGKKGAFTTAITLAMLVGGIGVSALKVTQTDAQTITPQVPNQVASSGGQFDPSKGGHTGANGIKEELLTGDTAEKVKAAALAAVTGGTIERVETDAEGSPYEAHMTKSDGTHVTVKVDSSFKVTNIETGNMGPGGH